MDFNQIIKEKNTSVWKVYEWDKMEPEFKKSLLSIFKSVEDKAYARKDFDTIFEIRSWLKNPGISVYWNSAGDVTNIKSYIPFKDFV